MLDAIDDRRTAPPLATQGDPTSTMRPRRWSMRALAAAWIAASLATSLAVYLVVHDAELHASTEQASRRTRADVTAIETVLAKNDALPFAMSLHPAVAAGLVRVNDPTAIGALDRYLADIARQSGVAAAYVIDRDGLTIAASNHDQPQTFVGRNYRFRPYAQDALAGRVGRFYGIGTTTSEPGYFLARAVRDAGDGRIIGAVVLKTNLDDVEQSWHGIDEPVALADADGIVFLANRPSWKYRSFTRLDAAVLARLDASRQYAGRTIVPIAAGRALDGGRIDLPVGPLGWHLVRFVSDAEATRDGVLAAVAFVLVASLLGLGLYAAHQRRAHVDAMLRSRAALERASADLETRIAARTGALTHANDELRARLDELRRTERILRATQDELVQAGKLGMLGQMAAGTVHELAQPLTALKAFAHNADAYLALGRHEDARANMAHIDSACERMQSIVMQLKTFARRSDEALRSVRLAIAIEHASLLVRADVERDDVMVDVRIDPAIGRDVAVLADPIRLEQVIVNLLRNALDAVRTMPVRAVTIAVQGDTDSSEIVVLRVVDTGPGLSDEVAAHLFEPFFTTKPAGEGLGLGLAISSAIVQAMRGTMTAKRAEGGGAEFVVTLPRVAFNDEGNA